MTHTARIAAVLGTLTLASLTGCMDVGAPKTGGVDDTSRRAALGITCEARVTLAGTFVRAAAQPTDVIGCWPVGHWEFSPVLEDSDCATDVALEQKYSFDVSRDADENYNYTVNTDPTGKHRVKVTSGGSGLCEGGLEIFSQDGLSVLNLKPQLAADGTISGFGEFTTYTANQWW